MIALSDRHQQIVCLVAEGLLDKEIAHRIGITPGTVKAHVSAILKKLNLSNRVKLAVWHVRREHEMQASMADLSGKDSEMAERFGRDALADALDARERTPEIRDPHL